MDSPRATNAGVGGGGRRLVTFNTGHGIDGTEYGLTEAARDFGFPALDEAILPAWPDTTGLRPVIERGLLLCGN